MGTNSSETSRDSPLGRSQIPINSTLDATPSRNPQIVLTGLPVLEACKTISSLKILGKWIAVQDPIRSRKENSFMGFMFSVSERH